MEAAGIEPAAFCDTSRRKRKFSKTTYSGTHPENLPMIAKGGFLRKMDCLNTVRILARVGDERATAPLPVDDSKSSELQRAAAN